MSVATHVRWRRRRSTVITTAILAVIALVVTGFAMRYPGLSSSRVEVNNGGVWVTSEAEGLMGRLNVDATELDARVSMSGDDLDILQSGYNVIEKGPRGMVPINTASALRGGLVEYLPGTKVELGGDRVAIAYPDGRVWILSVDEAGAFTPDGVKPIYTAASGVPDIAVSTTGTVFLLDGEQLVKYPYTPTAAQTTAEEPLPVEGISSSEEMRQLSTVGDTPVILDAENRQLRLGESAQVYSLEDYGVADFGSAQLQLPSSGSENFVVATEDTLFVIPFDGGDAQAIESNGAGTPARPAQAKGCAYGAWSGSVRYVRACEGSEPVVGTVEKADPSGTLTLRSNNDLVVLNDQKFGLSWAIASDMKLVNDWNLEQEIKTEETQEEEKETLTTTITNTAAKREEQNHDPVANDDAYGVRPGASVVLPVVRNDTDPDGDILSVAVDGAQPSIGTVTPIRGGTQLQIVVDEGATGSASFTYKADDGRKGSDTATVTLEVKEGADNEAPRPAEGVDTKIQVREGQEVSLNISPYWEDPDGDAFSLSNAVTEPEDVVTFRPDGLVTFTDAGLKAGTKKIEVTFRDERGEENTGIVQVEVVADHDLAPITTGDHVSIVAGRSTTVKPLVNDLNPNGGNLELLSVSETKGLEVEPALDTGVIDLNGVELGSYYLEYTVGSNGGSATSLGLIRVDVIEPASEDLVPVAVDDLGTVTTGGSSLIDPLENDVDPTAGVMVVNSVEVPEGSGLKATVVNHHLIRVEAEPGAAVSEEPVSLSYEVANGAGSTSGTIRVMLAKTETQFANPVGVPDRGVVRAGDMIDLDVITNDVSPTESDLHLAGFLDASDADAKGKVEAAQDRVRYRADDGASGEVSLTYRVVDETGREGSARATFTIIPQDATNTPPRPENLTARTVAGTSVRIPVQTSGIDPDGDSVMLTGITSPTPMHGEIISATGEWIEYRPYEGYAGSDSFSYQVMDRHGAIGTAEVLVGVAAPNDVNLPPYAVDDTIEVRPDRDVQVPVLENDTDPEGQLLSVARDEVEAITGIEVLPQDQETTDGVVSMTTPEEEGTHTVQYSASDGVQSSRATVTVKVSEDAPLLSPIARDDFVPAEEVLDPETDGVMVDVLANDTDPDGSIEDLEVTLEDPPEGAEVLEDGTVRITPQEEQLRLRYLITDVDGQESAGYIWVPGTAKQGPVWVGQPVSAQEGSEVSIDLSDPDNVRVRPGAQGVQITDPALVTAEHSDGGELVADAHTLVYRPVQDHPGQDTLSVEVTDGEPGDPTAATSVLAIPVEVAPEGTNEPPTLQGTTLDIEQGEGQGRLELDASAQDPEDDPLSFSLGDHREVEGVDISLEDSTFVASATSDSPKGEVLDVPVTVSDGTNEPVTATVQVTVVASTRPLIATVLDEETIDAGETKSIDVLANDSNPFPDGERTLIGAELTNGQGTVTPSGNSVEITPDEDFHGILTAQYTVQDATGDPDRERTGQIQVTVRGKPDAPSAPRIGEVGDGTVDLAFIAGNDNGAPITGYEVTTASGPAHTQQCPSTSCTIKGLTNNTEYTFEVVAVNDVGPSEASVASAAARPDVRPEKPATPTVERGDTQLTVNWTPPVNRGSSIQSYELRMHDSATHETSAIPVDGAATQKVLTGLTNGTDYTFEVRAHNLAADASEWSEASRAEHPAGKPAAPSGTPTAERVNDVMGGAITVSFPAMTKKEANGEPITHYVVTSSSGEQRKVTADKTTASFRDLDENSEHSFSYRGINSVGTSVAASGTSNAVVPWSVAEAPKSVKASLPNSGDTGNKSGPDGRVTLTWEPANGRGTKVKDYVITGPGLSKPIVVDAGTTSRTISGLTNGKAYTFQVQARNGFDGGQSAPSTASKAVTPYTKPAPPRVSASPGSCSGTSCTVNFSYSAGDSGGAGPVTLTCSINGGKFGSCKKSESGKGGKEHSITVRATNAEGLTAEASASAKSPYPKPTPSLSGAGTAGSANDQKGCKNGNCYYIDFTLSGLEPNTTYSYCLKGGGSINGACWYPTEDGVNYSPGTLTTDGSGRWQLRGGGRSPYWGNPDAAVWVWVEKDGKSADSNHVYPVR